MEIEETTTVENNDCDFVDIGDIGDIVDIVDSLYLTKTDLGNFVILFLFRLQKLSFSHKSVSFSFCSLYLFQNCLFTILVVTRLPFGFQYYPVQLVTCYPIPSYNNE